MAASTSMVVMVLDPDDDKRGEITVVDDPKAAARMVESFLEAGYKQERIRVFSATPLQMQIVQKPVVSFLNDTGSPATADKIDSESSDNEAGQEAAAVGAHRSS